MRITSATWLLAAGGAILLSSFMPRYAAHAADCDFSAPLNELSAVQNDQTLDDHDRLVKELDLRKQILGDITSCAITDASSLKTSLANITPSDRAAADLQTKLLNQINNSLSYYDLKQQMIVNLGLQGTKNYANDLESWRQSTEAPLEAQIKAFLLWENNQPLLSATESRYSQISHALVGLDLSADSDIAKTLGDAKSALSEATDANQSSFGLIDTGDAEGAEAGITKTLTSLKTIYQDFFTLSTAVQNVFSSG